MYQGIRSERLATLSPCKALIGTNLTSATNWAGAAEHTLTWASTSYIDNAYSTNVQIKFKVNDVRGMDAYTYFIGHDMTSDNVRRMTRRRKSKIDMTVDVKTRDDFIIRLKPLAISGRRIRASQQSAIRLTMGEVITRFCSKKALDEDEES